MTNNLISILNELVNCLEVVIEELDTNTKIDLLKIQLQGSEWNKYTEEQIHKVANVSLKLWNETLNCSHDDLIFILNVQELIFIALRSLNQPPFMNSDWLDIKTRISLSFGKKCLTFKDNSSFKEKAIQCFDYVEEIFYSQDAIGGTTSIECKVTTLLCHIEAFEDEPEKAKIINEELQIFIKNQLKPIIPAAIVFYNLGLKHFHKKCYSESVYWLLHSLDYGYNSDFQAQISTLLADVYLSWDGQLYWKRAETILNAIDKKFPIDSFIRFKTSLANPNCSVDQLCSIVNCCFEEKCSIERGIKIIEYLIGRTYKGLAINVISNWMKKHNYENLVNDPTNLQKVFYYQLKLLLESNQIQEIKQQIVEYLAIEGAKTSLSIMDLVEQVTSNFLNEDNLVSAMEWLNYCIEIGNRLNLHSNEAVTKRITKYYHQKCSCLIKQKNWKDAKNIISIIASSGNDYNFTLTQYLEMQICIGFDDQYGTIDALKQICEEYSVLKDGYDVFKMIMGCIKLGISLSRFSTVVAILEGINDRVDSCNTRIKLMELLLKCKLATKDNFSSIESQKWCKSFGEKIYNQFTNLKKEESSIDDTKLKWFVQMFWNIAHTNKENRILMNILMQWSNGLLSLCHGESPAVILQRKMCLLLAIISGAETSRGRKNLEQLKEITSLIEEYKKLSESRNSDSEKPPEMANTLIALLEFETKIELNSSDIEEFFEKCFSISGAEAKYYEILAAIAYKKNLLWSIACIREAIQNLQLQVQCNYKRMCQLYHSLVVFQIIRINSGEGEINDLNLTIGEITDLMEEKPSTKDEFPQDELAWLVARCWNTGVQRLVYLDNPTEAHNSCMAAMKLGLYLGVNYQRYLDKMNVAYPIMLKKNWSSY